MLDLLRTLTVGATAATVFAAILSSLPIVAAGLATLIPAWRTAVQTIPAHLIVALNTWRVLGIFMILAALGGVMSGPFPWVAGIGDIITGVFALPVARLIARNPRDVRVLEWNVFGALDLVVALFLGVTFRPSAMTTLPWVLIPLVLVPTYLIGHALVFVHVRAAARASWNAFQMREVSGSAGM